MISQSSMFTRPPRQPYVGTNGFMKGFTKPEDVNEYTIDSTLQAHRNALFVLEGKRRAIPDLEVMKAFVDFDDLTRVKEQIKDLKNNHLEDLQRLYARHAHDYKTEAMDRYLAADEYLFLEYRFEDMPDAKLKDFVAGPINNIPLELAWQNEHEHLRYVYLSHLISLEKQRRAIETAREIEKKRREKMFPNSKEDYNNKPKDIRLRAANFLVAGGSEKEKLLDAYGWASRQVKPLEDIFKNDEAFASEIRALVIDNNNVKDPRKRSLPQ